MIGQRLLSNFQTGFDERLDEEVLRFLGDDRGRIFPSLQEYWY